jgi:uncharacterized membrane protein
MTETKPTYKSKTFWAALMTLVAVGLAYFGVPYTAEEQAQNVEDIMKIVAAVGAIGTMLGRKVAKTKITLW